ncbi:MAG: UDP-glucose--hexose-1-phosphate uridylyltransferase [Caldicoprobacterales bacterium]|jgi:UDPglucose--hexose-1-phosphate uridylyltransferase
MNSAEHELKFLIEKLLQYAVYNHLIDNQDLVWARNQLIDLLNVNDPFYISADTEIDYVIPEYATPILEKILDYAYEAGILKDNTLTSRDLLDTRIMGLLLSKPSEIIKRFNNIKKEKGITAATDDFYQLCQKSNYIRMDRIHKNIRWFSNSPFGQLEITINLTKPEKDPKEIAALRNAPQYGYPKCLLCVENVGYAGRLNHPARQTHRTIPLELYGETWHFQYSPYVYYNEHCIVLNEKHVPMKITKATFHRLFEFLDLFPHYFIGSNADLPIVGGSILNHDHFQGGRHVLPMEKAKIEYRLFCEKYPSVKPAVLYWPMTVLRICSSNSEELIDFAYYILSGWREYSDPAFDILAYTQNKNSEAIPHNTITPIARKKDNGDYELDLVLRNNRTTNKHPLGVFHPHEDLHHIKKENIGLIEVMGLFILPGRLKKEIDSIKELMGSKTENELNELRNPDHMLHHHYFWVEEMIRKYGTGLSMQEIDDLVKKEITEKCLRILSDAGVYKATPAGRGGLNKFLASLGIRPI